MGIGHKLSYALLPNLLYKVVAFITWAFVNLCPFNPSLCIAPLLHEITKRPPDTNTEPPYITDYILGIPDTKTGTPETSARPYDMFS